MANRTHRPLLASTFAALMCFLVGCEPSSPGAEAKPAKMPVDPLIVYCSVDEPFARDVLDIFTARSGIKLSVLFDSEAGKTTGLVNRIMQEAKSGRPRADVFWSSELFHTILLARRGLLTAYESPAAADIPARFKDAQHRWTALAARARVIAYDPKRISSKLVPTTWHQLSDKDVAHRTTIANPLFGTTRGHVAAMFALWGSDSARAFLQGLRDGGARIADGNSSAVRALIAGQVQFAATDTDDVWVAKRGGASLDLVYPDLGDGGTLLIPCSVALVARGKNDQSESPRRRAAARRLVDFLVSLEVERMLARSDSRNIPVRDSLLAELGIQRPPETKIGFDAIADAMDEAVAAVREILIR